MNRMTALTVGASLLAAPAFFGPAAITPAEALELNAPAGTYRLDPRHASMFFRVGHLGLSNYTARIVDFDATIEFNPEDVEASTVSATIDPTSIETEFPGEKDFDAEIGEDPRFLAGGEFPEVTFTSTGIEVTGPDTANITGDLTLRGVTLPVILETTMNGAIAEHPFAKVGAIGISARGTIDRTAFGSDFLSPQVVAPEVEIVIEAEFIEERS